MSVEGQVIMASAERFCSIQILATLFFFLTSCSFFLLCTFHTTWSHPVCISLHPHLLSITFPFNPLSLSLRLLSPSPPTIPPPLLTCQPLFQVGHFLWLIKVVLHLNQDVHILNHQFLTKEGEDKIISDITALKWELSCKVISLTDLSAISSEPQQHFAPFFNLRCQSWEQN